MQLLLPDDTREQQIAEEITQEPDDNNAPGADNVAYREIDEYIVFVSENNPDDNSIFVRDYISGAIKHRNDALEQLTGQQDIALNSATLEHLRAQNEKIEAAEDADKAEVVKNTFQMISQAMESLQLNDSENLQTEIRTLQDMAHKIDISNDVEQQNDAVSSFLKQAGILLEFIEQEVKH